MEQELKEEIYKELKSILEPYAPKLDQKDGGWMMAPGGVGYCLNCKKEVKKGMPMFFGATSIGKNYVSYHLMPVYVDPSLLADISPDLKKRMQGKSCFNFKKIEPELYKELKALTKKSYQSFVKAGWIEK